MSSAGTAPRRFDALDSLRGLAALSVVMGHCLIVFPMFYLRSALTPLAYALTYSPLHLFWAGHEAVILFFVLSGFVLFLPFQRATAPSYPEYLVKRVCRIYLPYIAVVCMSGILLRFLSEFGIAGLSEWFNGMWKTPVTPATAVDMVLMLGQHTHNVDTATWSLVHEMRVSLIFPLLAYAVQRFSWKWSLCGSLAVSLLGTVGTSVLHAGDGDFIKTLYYIAFFVVGALIAKHRDALVASTQKLGRMMKILLLVGAILLYDWAWLVPTNRLLTHPLVSDWAITAGTICAFALCLAAPSLAKVLEHRVLRWLGKISFSLYLVHPVVLLTLVYSLHNRVPVAVLVALVPPLSLAVAALAYRTLEVPSMWLGRQLAARIRVSPTPRDASRDAVS